MSFLTDKDRAEISRIIVEQTGCSQGSADMTVHFIMPTIHQALARRNRVSRPRYVRHVEVSAAPMPETDMIGPD